MNSLPDWAIRSLKTFIQAFFGTLIPALCAILSKGFPENWSVFWVAISPVVAAGLSAAISAVWNIILERLK